MTEDRLISLGYTGQMFGGVCEKTIWRKIKAGELPQPVYLGRKPLLSYLEVMAVIEKKKQNRRN